MPMKLNRLHLLQDLGQAVWLEGLAPGLLRDGRLQRWVHERLISGVVSTGRQCGPPEAEVLYAEEIRSHLAGGADPSEILELVQLEDIRSAAKLLLPLHRRRGGEQGLVSRPLNGCGDDPALMVANARLAALRVDCANFLVEIAPTPAGLVAIRQLLAEGRSVVVAPLFSLETYRDVLECIAAGLEQSSASGHPLSAVVTIAGFDLRAIDAQVDSQLERAGEPQRALASSWRGRVAIALARAAYQHLRGFLRGHRWQALAARGAAVPRLLWSGTECDVAGEDTRYVDALVGPLTIVSLSPALLQAYLEHGRPAERLEELQGVDSLQADMQRLDVDLERIGRELGAHALQARARALQSCVARIARMATPPLQTSLAR